MERRYVVAMLRVDGISRNFVKGKESKSDLIRKRCALTDVIEKATQLRQGEYMILQSRNRLTVDIIGSNGPVASGAYMGRHTIYVYSDKIRIE